MKNREKQIHESEKIMMACLMCGAFIFTFAVLNAIVEVLIK